MHFEICYWNGNGSAYDVLQWTFGSGPDEGDVDREWYDFDYAEGPEDPFQGMRARKSPYSGRQARPWSLGAAIATQPMENDMRTPFRALIMAAAVMTLTAGAPAVANAGPTPTCWANANNGDVWGAYATGGYARFYEYGDKLEVVDTKSDGVRTQVYFQYCDTYNGKIYYYAHKGPVLDSGPNEGSVDREWYDFDYAERRIVRFKACTAAGCTGWVYGNA